jgi:hypothetical protein
VTDLKHISVIILILTIPASELGSRNPTSKTDLRVLVRGGEGEEGLSGDVLGGVVGLGGIISRW